MQSRDSLLNSTDNQLLNKVAPKIISPPSVLNIFKGHDSRGKKFTYFLLVPVSKLVEYHSSSIINPNDYYSIYSKVGEDVTEDEFKDVLDWYNNYAYFDDPIKQRFYYSIIHNDLEIAKEAVRDNNNILPQIYDSHLLHIAARYGSDHIAQWLIEDHGYKVDDIDEYGSTPLHEAARKNNLSTMFLLKQYDYCNILALKNNEGLIPLELLKAKFGDDSVSKFIYSYPVSVRQKALQLESELYNIITAFRLPYLMQLLEQNKFLLSTTIPIILGYYLPIDPYTMFALQACEKSTRESEQALKIKYLLSDNSSEVERDEEDLHSVEFSTQEDVNETYSWHSNKLKRIVRNLAQEVDEEANFSNMPQPTGCTLPPLIIPSSYSLEQRDFMPLDPEQTLPLTPSPISYYHKGEQDKNVFFPSAEPISIAKKVSKKKQKHTRQSSGPISYRVVEGVHNIPPLMLSSSCPNLHYYSPVSSTQLPSSMDSNTEDLSMSPPSSFFSCQSRRSSDSTDGAAIDTLPSCTTSESQPSDSPIEDPRHCIISYISPIVSSINRAVSRIAANQTQSSLHSLPATPYQQPKVVASPSSSILPPFRYSSEHTGSSIVEQNARELPW